MEIKIKLTAEDAAGLAGLLHLDAAHDGRDVHTLISAALQGFAALLAALGTEMARGADTPEGALRRIAAQEGHLVAPLARDLLALLSRPSRPGYDIEFTGLVGMGRAVGPGVSPKFLK